MSFRLKTEPESGFIKPFKCFNKTLFPIPLFPIIDIASPSLTSKETLFKTTVLEKDFLIFDTFIIVLFLPIYNQGTQLQHKRLQR